jgi:hypothetical protein
MKNILFLFFLTFLACSVNKPVPAIQTSFNSISACLKIALAKNMAKTNSVQISDTLSDSLKHYIDSLNHLDSLRTAQFNADFDTAYARYQSKDSLDFYFYVSPDCGATNFVLNPELIDSSTIKMNISYQGGAICDCKRKFEVSLYSNKNDLSYVRYIRFDRSIFGTTPHFYSGDTTIPLVLMK